MAQTDQTLVPKNMPPVKPNATVKKKSPGSMRKAMATKLAQMKGL